MEYNKNELKSRRRELRNNPSKAEKILWGLIRKRQINNVKFRRQFGIDRYVVDFYCAELKLIIEVDGDTHFGDKDVKHDRERQNNLEKYGIKFLRFTNDAVIDAPDIVINNIRDAVTSLQKL